MKKTFVKPVLRHELSLTGLTLQCISTCVIPVGEEE